MGCYRYFQADEREWNDPTDESDKKKSVSLLTGT